MQEKINEKKNLKYIISQIKPGYLSKMFINSNDYKKDESWKGGGGTEKKERKEEKKFSLGIG